jgi:pseudaminic acid synthase
VVPGNTPWQGKTLYELYGEAYTPWDWYEPLQAEAQRLGMEFFSTPFDATAVDFLDRLGVPAYKVASFELVDIPLLEKIGSTGRPVFVSTGMATLAEIREAVETLRSAGAGAIVLLKCTSGYPASPAEMNLRTIPNMVGEFGSLVGLSDHSLGSAAAVAAVALGAVLVEKHFTLRRADGGPDSGFSLEPAEFKTMVADIRLVEQALGRVNYEPTPKERNSLVFRRSLFVVADVKKGETFTASNVRAIRPGHGLHTRHLKEIIGRKAASDITRGTPLSRDMVSGL